LANPAVKAVVLAAGLAAALTAGFFNFDGASAEPFPDGDAYASSDVWLCRPGRKDACAVDQDATIVAADGKLALEPFRADPNAPIDCFYVYPTVSTEPGGNSDRVVGSEERRAVAQQFARFTARCRPFAPMYRQFTLAALASSATATSPRRGDTT